MNCESIQQLLPWYITGEIDMDTAAEIAGHLAACAACQSDFVEAAWMRRLVVGIAARSPRPTHKTWSRVARRAGIQDTARIDVGSFLIGFNLGINTANRHHPVRGTLRVMGHSVRIVGGKRRKEESRVQKG
jgi:anti-sigma factor RsiW